MKSSSACGALPEHAALRRAVCLAPAWMAPAAAVAGQLGDADRRWLASHPQIRFAPEHNYGPFVYAEQNGRIAGLSVDLLELAAGHVGLNYSTLPARPLSAILDAVRREEADLVSSVRPTPERAQTLNFTAPYVEVPAVLAVPSGGPAMTMADLAGRSVAVGQGYAVEGFARQRYAQINWVAVSDDTVAVRGVVGGRYAAAVLDVASLVFVTRIHGLSALRVADRVGFDYALSFAVRKDWPELARILDVGLGRIQTREREAVIERWLGTYADSIGDLPWSRASRIGAACVGAGSVLAAAAWWRHRRVRVRAGGAR